MVLLKKYLRSPPYFLASNTNTNTNTNTDCNKYWDEEERLSLDTYWRSPPCFLASRSKVKRVVNRRRVGRKQADLRSKLEDGLALVGGRVDLVR